MSINWKLALTLGLAAVVSCGDKDKSGDAWMPDTDSGGTDSEGTSTSAGSDTESTGTTMGSTTAGSSTTSGTTGSTGGVPVDCTPGWATPWIGSPCTADGDCAYDGGTCLTDNEGFPCGTCTMDCTMLCPDTPGTPTTYCINGTDVGLQDAGYCLSQCDEAILPGGEGCRDGYVCDVLTRFDDSGATGVCIPKEFDDGGPDNLVCEIDHAFLIWHLGGNVVDAFAYSDDLMGLQDYLDDVGVTYTSALDMAEPYNLEAATNCGLSLLLPTRDQWEKAAALGLFTDVLTDLVGEPIFVRNWWRPPCYNDMVGGAPNGDHPDADAFDLDFYSPTSRALAQKYLCEMYWDADILPPELIDPQCAPDPRLNLSVGLGGITIHLGVLSAGGKRSWFYDSYTAEPDSGGCW